MEISGKSHAILENICGEDEEEMQGDQAVSNEVAGYRRGDIPIFHDCDDRGQLKLDR